MPAISRPSSSRRKHESDSPSRKPVTSSLYVWTASRSSPASLSLTSRVMAMSYSRGTAPIASRGSVLGHLGPRLLVLAGGATRAPRHLVAPQEQDRDRHEVPEPRDNLLDRRARVPAEQAGEELADLAVLRQPVDRQHVVGGVVGGTDHTGRLQPEDRLRAEAGREHDQDHAGHAEERAHRERAATDVDAPAEQDGETDTERRTDQHLPALGIDRERDQEQR